MSKNMLGIVLIVVGVLALAYQGFTYTTREKIVDAGPIQISADKEHSVPFSPIVGGVALAAGLFLVFTSKRD